MRYLWVVLIGFQTLGFAQNMCDVYKMMLLDGKDKFVHFYGENNGALGEGNGQAGFVFNNNKSVRKDILNGQNFVKGMIYSYSLSELYEDVTIQGNVWNLKLNGPDIDFSAVPDSSRLNSLKKELKNFAEGIQKSCFPNLFLDEIQESGADSEYVCSLHICSKKPDENEIIQATILPTTVFLKLSIKKSEKLSNQYFIEYLFSYPVE